MKKFGLSDKVAGIGKIHGQIFLTDQKNSGKLNIIPLYHPATVAYNVNIKEILMKDFKIIKTIK